MTRAGVQPFHWSSTCEPELQVNTHSTLVSDFLITSVQVCCVRACRWHLSSQCHIVVPRHSGSDEKLAVSPMYVGLIEEVSKYVFIVCICAWDCGADMGGGSCPASEAHSGGY